MVLTKRRASFCQAAVVSHCKIMLMREVCYLDYMYERIYLRGGNEVLRSLMVESVHSKSHENFSGPLALRAKGGARK
jgi:hypothetical protein